MSVIQNERTKLFATALNNTAVATIVTAIIGPAAGFLYGFSGPGVNRWWFLLGFVWFLIGIGLHYVAQWVLGRLTDD